GGFDFAGNAVHNDIICHHITFRRAVGTANWADQVVDKGVIFYADIIATARDGQALKTTRHDVVLKGDVVGMGKSQLRSRGAATKGVEETARDLNIVALHRIHDRPPTRFTESLKVQAVEF